MKKSTRELEEISRLTAENLRLNEECRALWKGLDKTLALQLKKDFDDLGKKPNKEIIKETDFINKKLLEANEGLREEIQKARDCYEAEGDATTMDDILFNALVKWK